MYMPSIKTKWFYKTSSVESRDENIRYLRKSPAVAEGRQDEVNSVLMTVRIHKR